MFMVAVIESLKEVEIRNPQAEASEKDGIPASSQEPSRPTETSSSSIQHSTHSKSEPVLSAAAEVSVPLKADSHSQNSASDPSISSGDTSSAKESSLSTSVSSGSSDSFASGPSSSGTDVSHNTKAKLTVEKNNPAGHVMDGLVRRWDLNLFRNNS